MKGKAQLAGFRVPPQETPVQGTEMKQVPCLPSMRIAVFRGGSLQKMEAFFLSFIHMWDENCSKHKIGHFILLKASLDIFGQGWDGGALHTQNCDTDGDFRTHRWATSEWMPCGGHKGRKPCVPMTWSQLHSGRSLS